MQQRLNMKPNSLLLTAAGLLILAGCSSTPTKVDTGPIKGRTFKFVEPGAKPPPAYAEKRQVIHSMIQAAITKNLEGRGVRKVTSDPDLTVAYLVIVGNNATTTSIDDYFGYGEDAAKLHDQAHERYTASKGPDHFEAGTLVIDLVDAKSFRLVKRGYATRSILRNVPDETRAARIQGVVDEILKNLWIVP
jgi:uncharacterized protein DUF4136